MSAAFLPATPAAMRKYAGTPGLEVLDPATGETFSATAGDYWDHPADRPLTNASGEPLLLVRRVVTLEPVPAPEPERTPEGRALEDAFLTIGAILGGSLEWDGADVCEGVAEAIDRAARVLGMPGVGDQDEAAHRYWAAVGDRYHVEHDDVDELYGSEDDDDDEAELDLEAAVADEDTDLLDRHGWTLTEARAELADRRAEQARILGGAQ